MIDHNHHRSHSLLLFPPGPTVRDAETRTPRAPSDWRRLMSGTADPLIPSN